jgi:hypothetical protein
MKLRGLAWLLAFVAVGGLAAVLVFAKRRAPPDPGPGGVAWFEDVTQRVKLDFVHDCGPTGNYFMPQQFGSGAALFDFNNDGRLDIYLLNNGGPKGRPNQLFQQMPDGTFRDVSAGSGLDIAGHNMGVAIGDVNNDGWPDVLVTQYTGVKLFLNNGNGTFTDVTREAGLENPAWGTSASFVDYDRDGWLDLVVVNYVDYDPTVRCIGATARPDFCHPRVFTTTITRLFRNRGKQPNGKPVFDDVTLASGLARQPGPALGVLCADFNGDGWPDILVANDSKPNHLWINQKNGTFREEAVQRGCATNIAGQAEANMGVVFGDVDGDGLMDLFITHLSEETNTLWKQGPVGMFVDSTRAAGLTFPRWRGTGFGVILADFDHDGAVDLALVNGRVMRARGAKSTGFDWGDYAERNQVFANDGRGVFQDASLANPAFCETPGVGRGLCGGDVFNRGRVDLLATYIDAPARLYRNVTTEGHWLVVRAFAPQWKRDAYGAVVTLHAGGRKWMRLVQPGSSYLCSNDPRVHFGLGPVGKIDSIHVAWPDGSGETFPGVPADQHLTVVKGKGTPAKGA